MIQHFSFKPLFENAQLPGWAITFFYKRERYAAEYLKDGSIKWLGSVPSDEEVVAKIIHELMLFHVYE
ncbi:MAG: YheE family protein [Lysinibacillus sp.]